MDDPLTFTQSDMHVSNFGVDKSGKTVLLDFGQIGRLPMSFAKYTVGLGRDDSFTGHVARLLQWPDSANIDTMARVSRCLWMTANPKLGGTIYNLFEMTKHTDLHHIQAWTRAADPAAEDRYWYLSCE